MDEEVRRWAVVDRGRIQSEGAHLALSNEQLRCLLTVGWEVKMRRVAGRVVAQIPLSIGPALSPPRPQEHDRAWRDPAVPLLERAHVVDGQAVVGVGLGLLRNVE